MDYVFTQADHDYVTPAGWDLLDFIYEVYEEDPDLRLIGWVFRQDLLYVYPDGREEIIDNLFLTQLVSFPNETKEEILERSIEQTALLLSIINP